MNPPDRALVSYLIEIQSRTFGFLELRTDVDGWCADIELDASYRLFTPKCIFDDCNDSQAKLFLDSFLSQNLSVSWSVSEQLSKLLSKRGHLVSETMDRLLTTLNWSTIGEHLLFLSYLAVREDGASLACQLLDQVPEDGRDALFLVCYRVSSEELDRKLMAKFEEWGREGWAPSGTGELYALEQFIAKWLALYPYEDLEAVIRLFFKHRAESESLSSVVSKH